MEEYRLTTIDNPFNPFTDWINWLNYDMTHGYNTCGRIARLTDNVSLMTDEERYKDTENAIDFIILNDPTRIYRKVSRNDSFGSEKVVKDIESLEKANIEVSESF